MSRCKPPRKKYRPRPVLANANARAMNAVTKLTAEEIEQACGALESAFTLFGLEKRDQAQQWAIMADAMNVAEALADERICSDVASRETIAQAQTALARLHRQQQVLGSWAMWDDDRKALLAGIELHRIQLSACDYAEYRRAIDGVIRRMRGARAGNVVPGTTILEAANG